jgi:hypothetical protein
MHFSTTNQWLQGRLVYTTSRKAMTFKWDAFLDDSG